ncbi:MAG: hypothetical protein AB7O45_05250 [Alphaproteobacteria bacterium]
MRVPSAAEIARAVDGAWRLACRDASGLRAFDPTLEAFWRSFFAAVVVAPFYVLMLALRDLPAEPRGGLAVMALVEAIGYVANWVAFPLVMAHVSRLIGRERHYLVFVQAFNWSAVIQVVMLLAGSLIAAADLLPSALAQGIVIGVTLLVLVYEWYIARVALELGGAGAAGIVALDLAIGIFLNGAGQSIYL